MSEIFRDRTEGAIARRQDLLRRRRDELVMMPHAVRRVVVARAARAAAAAALCVGGIAMLVVAATPSLAALIRSGLPGFNPAVVSGAGTSFSGRNLFGVEWVLPTGEVVTLGSAGSGCGWFSPDGPGPSMRGIVRGFQGTLGGLGVFTRCAIKLY